MYTVREAPSGGWDVLYRGNLFRYCGEFRGTAEMLAVIANQRDELVEEVAELKKLISELRWYVAQYAGWKAPELAVRIQKALTPKKIQ